MIKAHLAYLKYVLLHKKYVAEACEFYGVSKWRAFTHDWTKFLPSEWFPYVNAFYNPDGSRRDTRTDRGTLDTSKVSESFALAWRKHQTRNPHHWQYWVVINDQDGITPLPMPETYIREMLADWSGAGKAITGESNPMFWYAANADKMILHPKTIAILDELPVYEENE